MTSTSEPSLPFLRAAAAPPRPAACPLPQVLGPNGAGKSTLLKAISGALPLWAGSRALGDGVRLAVFSQDLAQVGGRGVSVHMCGVGVSGLGVLVVRLTAASQDLLQVQLKRNGLQAEAYPLLGAAHGRGLATSGAPPPYHTIPYKWSVKMCKLVYALTRAPIPSHPCTA